MYLFELNIKAEHEESFDHEVEEVESLEEAKEQAESFGEMVIQDDLKQGDIPVDSFNITVEAELVEEK